jgi:enoyl-CoA hydratase/carnithine racemase
MGEVRYAVNGAVATFTIQGYNDLNPMTPEMYVELHQALLAFEDDPQVRVGIIRGAGDKHFSAGEDLKHSAGLLETSLGEAGVLRNFWYPGERKPLAPSVGYDTLFSRQTIKPIVAAVNGYCLGSALAILTLHADIRIAGQGARFGLPETSVGMAAGATGAALANQIPGLGLNWLLETGQPVDAQRALDWCLVNEIVPDDQTFARAQDIAEQIAGYPPAALRAEKLGIVQLQNLPFEQASFMASALRAAIQ